MIRRALAALALAFALAHIPFLAPSLEDIDSVNFALGVRDFDVADHRPHPPGYPVYIAFGKVAAFLTAAAVDQPLPSQTEAKALSILSLVGGVLAIFGMYGVLRAISGSEAHALAATALAASCPLFWYLAVRPMSDVPGLAAALAAQACLALAWWRQRPDETGDRRLTPARMEASGQMIVLGALLSGLAIGFRSQNAMLTLPLFVGVLFDRIGRGVAGAIVGGAVAMGVGAALWAVPLVVASGGVDSYLAALGSQAGEDFAGVEMLYLNPGNARLAAFALLRTFIYPWDTLVLGGIVTTLAAAGAAMLLVRDVRMFVGIFLLVVPYVVFHLLFHDTTFVRYALPVVPAMAFLAIGGLEAILRRAALPVAGALALWAVTVAAPVLSAYAAEPSPAVRALDEMRRSPEPPGALAMHQTFQRPLQAEDVNFSRVLPSPPRREWLELTKYWREGNTAPVWFLADPRRTDLALIDPKSRAERVDFSWSWESLNDMGGMRPRAAHWYRLASPGWFAEEGWALTPETAGIAQLMGRGPSFGPITAYVRRRPEALHLLIGGRHLGPPGSPPVDFELAIDGQHLTWQADPGFFLREFSLPAGSVSGEGLAALTIRANSGQGGSTPTAIEQFDVQSAGALMWGYDEGWHESEYSPAIGLWRWTSDRAMLRLVNATRPVLVTLNFESPLRYFDDPPTVRLVAGTEVVAETSLSDQTMWSVRVAPEVVERAGGRLAIETNRTFVPADRDGVGDQRRLGLRVFGVNVQIEY